jgi:ribonuclease HI
MIEVYTAAHSYARPDTLRGPSIWAFAYRIGAIKGQLTATNASSHTMSTTFGRLERATQRQAELTAVLEAIKRIPDSLEIITATVYPDFVLSHKWGAGEYADLVREIRFEAKRRIKPIGIRSIARGKAKSTPVSAAISLAKYQADIWLGESIGGG